VRSTMIRPSHPFHADPRFLLEPFEPAYLALHRAGALAERVTAGLRELEECCACPRNCRSVRTAIEEKALACERDLLPGSGCSSAFTPCLDAALDIESARLDGRFARA
jgi:hypothetical protein